MSMAVMVVALCTRIITNPKMAKIIETRSSLNFNKGNPMPLVLARPNDEGSVDVMIVLGPENIERIKEKDPVEVRFWQMAFADSKIHMVGISYASDAEMTQMEQLLRQGKMSEAIQMAVSGWKYRPDLGDHDLPPEKYR
jgi:hypothetical protein